MTWIRLYEGNDWGHKFYAPYPCKGTWSKHRDGTVSNIGKQVTVRWPDGTVELVSVGSDTYHQRIYDHGHEYDASGICPVLLMQRHGISIKVPLDKVQVQESEWPLENPP